LASKTQKGNDKVLQTPPFWGDFAETSLKSQQFTEEPMPTELEESLELKALEDGSKRYLKSLEASSSRKVPLERADLRRVLKETLPKVSLHVRMKFEEERKGRHSLAYQLINKLDPDLIALAGLSCAFRVISQLKTMSSMCHIIGAAIDDELWAAKLYKTDPKLAKRIVQKATRNHGNLQYRRKAVKATAKTEGHISSILSDEEKVKVGGFVMDCILNAVPEVFQCTLHKTKTTAHNYLTLTPEVSQELLELREVQSWMHPAYKPMTLPPKPWVGFWNGCYHNPKVARTVTLVRTRKKKHIAIVEKAIKDGTMSHCLEALNAIQNTRWMINTPIHDIVEWAYEQNLSLDSFPPRHHIPKVQFPADYATLDEKAKKGWRIKAGQVHQRNRGIDSERIVMLQDMTTAKALLGVPFYIPHNMDFRGRVYPLPHFNQQRADYVKAQLQFAEGRVLTEAGVYWLAVHLANCGDFQKVSKQPFDTRVQWVADNEELIFDVARDPQGTFSRWKQADKPFSFVAACLAWYGYRMDPENFLCHLPVAMDGSNSGLQHYSCMMRSEREGALVNLMPTDKPADLYQTVANMVKETVEADVLKGSEVAQIVLKNGVTRSLCKRATMTFAYSSEEFGFREQLMDDVMNPLATEILMGKRTAHPYEMLRETKDGEVRMDGGFTAASYIAKAIWNAVNTIVTDACTGMAFFRRCAQLLAHEGKGLVWVTPVGLPVLHLYPEYKAKRVKLFLHDREVELMTREDTDSVNKAKAADAVSPNVVHSLDSAALMLCVLDCAEAGVKDFSLIHDSFGAHPNDTQTMYVAVRQSLANMYEAYCPFEEIRRQTYAALDAKEKLPAIPKTGNLDLACILDADYAFA
jgi:DNA-directed RNA polymerase